MTKKNWLDLVKVVVPMILAETPAAPIAPFIAIGISAAEQIPGATGPQKLEVAKQLANIGVAAANAQAGKELINPSLVNETADNSIKTIISVMNLADSLKDMPVEPPK